MADSRIELKNPEELDPQKSTHEYRRSSVIEEEVAKAEKILNEKPKELMKSQQLKKLALTFNESGNYKLAQEYFNAALENVQQDTLPLDEKNLFIGECYYGLANCERELGFQDNAFDLFRKAKTQIEGISGEPEGLYDLKYTLARNIGITYLIVKDYKNASIDFAEAVKIAEKTQQFARVAAVKSYYGLSLVLLSNSADEIAQGFKMLEEARSLYPKNRREESMDFASNRYHMGLAFEKAGKFIDALCEFKESLRLRKQMIDPKKIGMVYYLSRLADPNAGIGRICLALGCKNEAKPYLDDALNGYQALGVGATKKAHEVRNLISSLTSEIPSSAETMQSVSITQASSSLFYLSKQNKQPDSDSLTANTTNRKPGLSTTKLL